MSEQFDEQGNSFDTDDVEAHRIPDHVGRDLDVEGHLETPESPRQIELDEDDVEGHLGRQIEVDDDVVGKGGFQVQPPRDADNQGNQF
jgi:hypothetical protein